MKSSRAEIAYKKIKQQILDRKIQPGQAVFETDLARDFKMSRTPVREALRRLETEGHFEIVKRKGAFLRTLTLEQLIKCYEVSEGLEGMLAFHLAERIANGLPADDFLKEMDELIARMDEADGDDDIYRWIEADTDFHIRMHKACDNPFLLEFLERLQTYFDSVSLLIIPMYIQKNKKAANNEHRDMINYIRAGNSPKAREVAQLQRVRVRRFMESIQKAETLFDGRQP
jgi:DNA-binding GntR family transcriptional regulator